MSQEVSKPPNHAPPDTFTRKIAFYGRMLLDLQMLTIYRDLKRELRTYRGAVLDVGCGQSPYRFLLSKSKVQYAGIDIADADDKFGYDNPDVTYFNGVDIPFPDSTFNGIICTEVLEHVQTYQLLVDEIWRVMRPGAQGVFTIPWSARYHYIPNDFFRYTPSSLEIIFAKFNGVTISERGSDIAIIANKLIVLWGRNIIPKSRWKLPLIPLWLVTLPVVAVSVVAAHVSLLLHLGSEDDPLGYTIVVTK
ncbi:Methyltransferase domain-containing protein [Frankineae bacterium MT45]|nr:Methyltransferase domain-containing protein [Frankineae bacterium MT45]